MSPRTESEKRLDLLWQGRVHLGDETGVYDDARYGGLCLELPVQLFPFNSEIKEGDITFLLTTEGVQEFAGYPGHKLEIFGSSEDDANPGHWRRKALVAQRIKSPGEGTTEVRIHGMIPEYVSVSIGIDTELPPGMYDEIIVRRLSMVSKTHYGLVGFRRHADVPTHILESW